MLYFLSGFEDIFGPLRLFEYVTFRAAGATFTAMLACILFGPLTVKFLKKFRVAAPERLKGLVDEKFIDSNKEKTPSMGGILIVAAITLSTLLWTVLSNPLVIVFLAVLLSLGMLGFLDDYSKISGTGGMSGRSKLIFQFIIAFSAVYALDNCPQTGSYMNQLMVPFHKLPILIMPAAVAYLFSSVVVAGSSNAVNLTDGKDGLAVGCAVFCTLSYATFAYLCGHRIFAGYLHIPFIPGASEVVVFAAAVAGACIGFLWHNCYPASMFMGDTGSLPLGGTIGLIAVLVRQELILIVVGGVFVLEALSVIIQVASFKMFGKRVFLCTPIHHHFEQKGWTETQIVVRFWIISGVLALFGLATLKLR